MRLRILLTIAAILAGCQVMTAIPARPGKMVYTQPDGTKIVLQRHGDEFAHWTTDEAGRVVTRGADGFYREVPGVTAEQARRRAASRRAEARKRRAATAAPARAVSGTRHFLVILVEFQNKTFTSSADPNAAYTDQMNKAGYSANGATGSARDYYFDNSHGGFTPVFDVYGPVKVSQNYEYYGENDSRDDDMHPEEAVYEACQLLDEEIDFSRYDNDGDGDVDLVFMYYAGHGEADYEDTDTIWPHQWSLASAGKSLTLDNKVVSTYACSNELAGMGDLAGKMDGIGTACHEFGHAMGLPDLYDTDYEDNGESGGLYSYSLMSGGGYNNDDRTPPYLCFEERMFLGWVQESDYLEFSRTGTYTIPSINNDVAYRTFTDMEGEYFVYENRSKTGWDRYIPAEGLLVFHADKSDRTVTIDGNSYTAGNLWQNWVYTNSINANGDHPCFYLVPAGNQSSLNYSSEERIPFPSRNVNSYEPVSWNGVKGAVSFSNISLSSNVVTLKATVATGDLDYATIADAGTYHAGDRFTFALVRPDEVEAPASVAWFFDDEPAQADSVTLTAGAHTVEARLTFSDGRSELLTLEIEVN